MKSYFINPDDGRLRAGWRILLFIIFFMMVSLAGQTLVKYIYGGIPKTTAYLRNSMVIFIAALAASLAVPVARRFFDKKSFRSLGLKLDANTAKDLLFGFVLSGFMAASVFFIMQAAGLIEVAGINWGGNGGENQPGGSLSAYLAMVSLGSLAFFLVMDVVVAWWEELVFRGYLLQNMIEGMGLVIAVALSCLIYGLVHITNPNAGLLSTAIIVLFGYLRIYGYLATGQLWLSMGMHIGWNFFQGPVFGYAASGQETASLISQTPAGPAWLSGGAFGPEGSILIIPVIGLALLVMRWWSKRPASTSGSETLFSAANGQLEA